MTATIHSMSDDDRDDLILSLADLLGDYGISHAHVKATYLANALSAFEDGVDFIVPPPTPPDHSIDLSRLSGLAGLVIDLINQRVPKNSDIAKLVKEVGLLFGLGDKHEPSNKLRDTSFDDF